jgi:hypothetical protein
MSSSSLKLTSLVDFDQKSLLREQTTRCPDGKETARLTVQQYPRPALPLTLPSGSENPLTFPTIPVRKFAMLTRGVPASLPVASTARTSSRASSAATGKRHATSWQPPSSRSASSATSSTSAPSATSPRTRFCRPTWPPTSATPSSRPAMSWSSPPPGRWESPAPSWATTSASSWTTW